jgi:hypothetical protein
MSQSATLVKQFSNGRQAPAIRVSQDVDPAILVAELKLPKASRLLMISGGAANMSDEIFTRLVTLFAEVGKLVRDDGITVIDGGTQSGVMKLMGQALGRAGAAVTHIGVLPAYAEVDDHGTHAEDTLEPHHSCFVLVESDTWGSEVEVMYNLAAHLSIDIPSVAMLINGGSIALQEIEKNVEQGREIVVIVGSGRLADEIADAILNPGPHVSERIAAIVENGNLTLFNLAAPPDRLAAILQQRLTKPF